MPVGITKSNRLFGKYAGQTQLRRGRIQAINALAAMAKGRPPKKSYKKKKYVSSRYSRGRDFRSV